jgi:hypothetical protein
MVEWLKDHVAVMGSLKLNTLVYWLKFGYNGDRAGPLGESGDN